MKNKLYPTLEMPYMEELKVPSKVISVNEAINGYNNFYNTRITKDPSDATRSVWFNFEMLEKHLSNIETIAKEKGIEITRLAFLLGADENNKRTVFIAPMTFDEKYGIHRAFSLDNGAITYINRFPIEEYSDTEGLVDLQDKKQSLILGATGTISSAEAIRLYNNYYDSKVKPLSQEVEADTRFVFYEKGVFEEYLQYLKKHENIAKTTFSGINIIFSAYDDHKSQGEYANHQTIFFAPTEEGFRNNIAAVSFDGKVCNRLELSKEITEIRNIIFSSKASFTFNEGGVRPPPYNWD